MYWRSSLLVIQHTGQYNPSLVVGHLTDLKIDERQKSYSNIKS